MLAAVSYRKTSVRASGVDSSGGAITIFAVSQPDSKFGHPLVDEVRALTAPTRRLAAALSLPLTCHLSSALLTSPLCGSINVR